MSVRPRAPRTANKNANAAAMRPMSAQTAVSGNELRGMQQKAAIETSLMPKDEATLTMDDLTPIQQSVALLGEEPSQLQPIEWLNAAPYQGLLPQNMISATLARRVEARRYVSAKLA
jgi:hypothetical protein